MKVPKEKLDEIREKLLTKLQVTNRETDYLKIDQYRIRLTNVIIPNLKTPVDIDISFVAEKKDYISTEAALLSRLNQIKSQDEEKYKLIIANIMFAKDMLKKKNAYKPAKSLKAPDKINGALGGVGIENWILQNGGSIIDAAKDFLAHAEDKSFFEFEQIYGVMDFGKNHITVARGGFPYDNFLMKNMRKNGYQNMKQALLEFTNSLNLDSKRTLK